MSADERLVISSLCVHLCSLLELTGFSGPEAAPKYAHRQPILPAIYRSPRVYLVNALHFERYTIPLNPLDLTKRLTEVTPIADRQLLYKKGFAPDSPTEDATYR